ncbi:MAG: hypothetical protein QG635_2329 [Bacteroidota bacterium]|nr:hypothetical protein [Bacteroidota bacterium]
MKKKNILFSLLIVVAVGIIGGGIGFYYYMKPVKNYAASEADIIIGARELIAEFAKNETAANLKYVSGNKTIQVSGRIGDIRQNDNGTETIVIEAGSPDETVSCTLIKYKAAAAVKYKAGSAITIKGQCTGYQELISKEVIMIRCGIVE